MHDVLRQRLLRRIESLPEEQVYQVLDYIEFLESKYSRHLPQEATGLQRFGEELENRLRRKAVSPATIREAFQLISAADRVLSGVSTAGSRLLGELGALADELPQGRGPATQDRPDGASVPSVGSPREAAPPARRASPDPSAPGGPDGGRPAPDLPPSSASHPPGKQEAP